MSLCSQASPIFRMSANFCDALYWWQNLNQTLLK